VILKEVPTAPAAVGILSICLLIVHAVKCACVTHE
jgi:hypothetical protein